METKATQHERRMATMQRVLNKLRDELEQKKAKAPADGDGDRPVRRRAQRARRSSRRLDA